MPWELDEKYADVEDDRQIRIDYKERITEFDMPNSLKQYFQIVRALKYEEQPNYEILQNLFFSQKLNKYI